MGTPPKTHITGLLPSVAMYRSGSKRAELISRAVMNIVLLLFAKMTPFCMGPSLAIHWALSGC